MITNILYLKSGFLSTEYCIHSAFMLEYQGTRKEPNMAFDGIMTRAVAHELQEKLTLGKIEKVYQPEADELIFSIYTKQGNVKLYASANSSSARVHLIKENIPSPPPPHPGRSISAVHHSGYWIAQGPF